MCINPIRHRYQPRFTLLSDKDSKEILEKFDAKPIMLGAICTDDPVNRYYAGRVGQVYEIVRNGTSMYYRRVVAKRMNLD
jgi:DNA-directed RNA polymerase subunit H (RpoH/RPB5)